MTPTSLPERCPLRRLFILAAIALTLITQAVTVLAQGISINAAFNPPTTAVGEPVEFNVIISGTNRNQGPPPLPSADGVQFR